MSETVSKLGVSGSGLTAHVGHNNSKISPYSEDYANPNIASARDAGNKGKTKTVTNEIIVSGIIENDVADAIETAHAIIGTLLPTINKNNIVSARYARSNGRRDARSARRSVNLSRPSPVIMRLSDSELVGDVMKAKRGFNYFHTRDINLSLLDQEYRSKLIDSKIFINHLLHPNVYRELLSLKSIARDLGFKYVWQLNGVFLVKWRDGHRSHSFSTASELNTIAQLYNIKSKAAHNNDARDSNEGESSVEIEHLPSDGPVNAPK